MTVERLAELLVNGVIVERDNGDGVLSTLLAQKRPAPTEQRGDMNKKVNVYLNRLLLRIFSVPSLMTYLDGVMPVKNEQGGEGTVKIQLDFLRLPDEIIPQLERLIAAPKRPRYFKYVKNGSARFGVEIEVSPDDLEGADYDYAF